MPERIWEDIMRQFCATGLAGVALLASPALADGHLKYTPGEGPFSWDSYAA